MRHLKAALVGLAGGIVLTAAVLGAEMVHAERSVSAQLKDCRTSVYYDRTETTCDSALQLGGLEVPVAFALGFVPAFAWFLRAHRRPIQ